MKRTTYRKTSLKMLEWKKIHLLTEKRDPKTKMPVPFSIKVACQNGDIIEGDNWITTHCDNRKKRRTIKNLDSGQVRTICDVLVLRINDTEIVVS